MSFLINEARIRQIARAALHEAVMFGFQFDRLKSLPSFAARYRYCKEYLGEPVGNGSARVVFQLDDRWVLKLAKNEKGLAQNEREGAADWYRDQFGVFPEVYYDLSDEDRYTYIVSEYVLPAKAEDFNKCLGLTANGFFTFLKKCAEQYTRRRPNQSTVMSDWVYEQLLEKNEELEKWNNYMGDYQAPAMDLRIANFGLALRDGEPTIVMLDNGLDEDIFTKYYSRGR